MKLYAEARSRAIRQVIFDVITVAWIGGWTWLGLYVHQRVSASETGARKIERSGGSLAQSLHDAAVTLSHAPLVGGQVRKPLDNAAGAATNLQHAGRQLADNLGNLGAAVGFEIALVPVLVAVFGWLFLRIGYARRAGRAGALRSLPGGADLLALDGLTRLPASTVAELGPQPVEKWRSGDTQLVGDLAGRYLRSLGLSTPGDWASGSTSTGRRSAAGGDHEDASADT